MIQKEDSIIITNLRGILALLVVYIHFGASYTFICQTEYNLLSGQGMVNAIVLTIHLISTLAVPMFFIISGFLFFNNLDIWDVKIWKQKVQKRIFTLLIPYIVWNIIAVLFSDNIIGNISNPRFLWDIISWGKDTYNWYGASLASSGPQNVPLWFIRDLIGMVIFSPVIFYLTKKIGVILPILFFILQSTHTYPYCPGFGSLSFTYFSLGAYFQLNHHSIINTIRKQKKTISALYLFLFVIVAYSGTNSLCKNVTHDIYIAFGTLFCFLLFGMIKNHMIIKINKQLSDSSFLIFASHSILLGHIVDILYRYMPGVGLIKFTPTFIIAPIITVAIITIIYKISILLFPKSILQVFGIRQ